VKDFANIDTTTEDNFILRRLNDVQWSLYNMNYHWKVLEGYPTCSTVDAQAYVTVPSTVAMIYDIRQTSSAPYAKLTYVEPGRFNTILPQPTAYSEGKPVYYTWWGGRIWLYPIPDDAYTLTIFGYSKPVNMKVYQTSSATLATGSTISASAAEFANNANVDTNMHFAYDVDVRSDGTYPWSSISAVGSNSSLSISTYGGAGSSGAATCASVSSFSEDFDLVLVYGTLMQSAIKFGEIKDRLPFFQSEHDRQLAALIKTNAKVPDYRPVARDFESHREASLGDYEAKFPFIKENL
jgi:hypothetical protein